MHGPGKDWLENPQVISVYPAIVAASQVVRQCVLLDSRKVFIAAVQQAAGVFVR